MTLDATKSCTATFESVTPYTLTVTASGSGSVTSNPAGISCPSDCSEAYVSGTVVTLTATPAVGWAFSGWGDWCSGGTATAYHVTLDAAKSCTATFSPVTPIATFTQVSAGWGHTCGLHNDGSVTCWGNNEYGVATPPAGTFTQVSAGSGHTCGVRSDRSVACWGFNYYGQASPP